MGKGYTCSIVLTSMQNRTNMASSNLSLDTYVAFCTNILGKLLNGLKAVQTWPPSLGRQSRRKTKPTCKKLHATERAAIMHILLRLWAADTVRENLQNTYIYMHRLSQRQKLINFRRYDKFGHCLKKSVLSTSWHCVQHPHLNCIHKTKKKDEQLKQG